MSEMDIDREATLNGYAGPDRVVHFTEYLNTRSPAAGVILNMKSGFASFDEHLGGLETGELTTVTGHTRNGKTLFAESWMRRLTDAGYPSCFFSFEVSAAKALQKYQAQDSALRPLYLPLDLKTMAVDWLIDRIEEAKIKYNCRVFVIDHLHFIVDMMTQHNMSLNIGATMRRLKMACNSLNVAVVLIAHQGQGKEKEATLEGIRDSSFIGQESDNVIVVSRRKDFTYNELRDFPQEKREKIERRSAPILDLEHPYKSGFCIVQIAKDRRTGTFEWNKLFQKNGDWLEEV